MPRLAETASEVLPCAVRRLWTAPLPLCPAGVASRRTAVVITTESTAPPRLTPIRGVAHPQLPYAKLNPGRQNMQSILG